MSEAAVGLTAFASWVSVLEETGLVVVLVVWD